MEIKPIALFRSPFKEKFGIPRQSNLIQELKGTIVLEKRFSSEQALRGLDGFEYIWLIWGFNLNPSETVSLLVRPPRLGGNKKVGVFASRSPFRPNPLGLSCVRIEEIDLTIGEIKVSGADLSDGTPIYDIKPYIPYSDAHSSAACGFADRVKWETLSVKPLNKDLEDKIKSYLCEDDYGALLKCLEQDPRPQYQKKSSPHKIYGLHYSNYNITFIVDGDELTITDITPL